MYFFYFYKNINDFLGPKTDVEVEEAPVEKVKKDEDGSDEED